MNIVNKKTALLMVVFIACTSSLVFGQNDKDRHKGKGIKTILFICEHGAGRSTIAASYFNKIATAQRLKYRAIFRGVEPQEALGASTKNGLIKDGIDVTNLVPVGLSENDIDSAYKVITLDCTLPDNMKMKVDMQWTGIEMNGNYDVSKNQITQKVDALIAQLQKTKAKR
jgi:protein-tyrosine-phosphatase